MNGLDNALLAKIDADNGEGGAATLTAGGFHKMVAPHGTAFPHATYQTISETPDYTLTAEYIRRIRFQVKAYDNNGDWNLPGQITDRLEALLVDSEITNIEGWTWKKTRLLQRFDLSEDEGDIIYAVTISEFIIELSPNEG